jgi:hypothetical protein
MVRGTLITLACSGALVALGINAPAESGDDSPRGVVTNALRALHDRDLNRDAGDADVAGYYQGLRAGRPRTLLGRATDGANYHFRRDFRYYEARPNVDWPEHDGSGRHITNSFGISDREYSVERVPRSHRIAVVGDSIARGQGAPFGQSFEALVEARLNAERTRDDVAIYELINFSTTGYRLTQMLDLALETVPSFKPDVYLLCLTRLSVGNAWGDHLAQLVYDRMDLKYPYLRELAVSANLDARDSIGTMRAKLEPFRLQAIRWALQEIGDRARRDGAVLVVAFVPTVNSPKSQERRFGAVRPVVAELGLPLIDVLDVFGAGDLNTLRVAPGNDHPNTEGHRMIARVLYDRMLADPKVAAIMLGTAVTGLAVDGPTTASPWSRVP